MAESISDKSIESNQQQDNNEISENVIENKETIFPTTEEYRLKIKEQVQQAYSTFPDQSLIDIDGLNKLMNLLDEYPEDIPLVDYGYSGIPNENSEIEIKDHYSIQDLSDPKHSHSTDGYVLFSRTWSPRNQKPSAKIIFFHGIGEHIVKYNRAFCLLVKECNVSILSFDQRGCGHNLFHPNNRNLSKSGDSEGHAVIMSDADSFLFGNRTISEIPKIDNTKYGHNSLNSRFFNESEVGKKFPSFYDENIPFYIMGHSMGGGLGLFYARTRSTDNNVVPKVCASLYLDKFPIKLAGVLVTSPALHLAETTRPGIAFKKFVQFCNNIFPKFAISTRILPDEISSSPVNNYNNVADPMVHGNTTLRSVTDLVLYGETIYDEAYLVAYAAKGQPINANLFKRTVNKLIGRECTDCPTDERLHIGHGHAKTGKDQVSSTEVIPEGFIQFIERVPGTIIHGPGDKICSPKASQEFVDNVNEYYKWKVASNKKEVSNSKLNLEEEVQKSLNHSIWEYIELQGFKHDILNETFDHTCLVVNHIKHFINKTLTK